MAAWLGRLRAASMDWRPETWGPRLDHARAVLRFAAARAAEIRLPQVAASLTFTTVLSLVPLLAVALSIFSTFPMFAEFRATVEKTLLRELLPEQFATVVLRYLNDFAAKAARLTAFGLGFLALTAMMMISTVDRVLNDLWHVRVQRPLLQRVLIYWALISLGPLVIGGSLTATSYVLSGSWTRRVPDAVVALADYGPIFVGGFAYSALFVFVPNRRVLWRDALIGGFIASVLGEFVKDGFAAYIKAGTMASIYGAFGVVPLFLIWVYLSWLTLLFGAAVAATIPTLRVTRLTDQTRVGNDFVTAVALLRELLSGLTHGTPDRTADDLSRATRTRDEDTERLLMELERLGYVRQLGGAYAGAWRLVADPATTNLVAAFARFAVDPANTLIARDRTGLGAWVQDGLRAAWIERPLRHLMAEALPERKAQAS